MDIKKRRLREALILEKNVLFALGVVTGILFLGHDSFCSAQEPKAPAAGSARYLFEIKLDKAQEGSLNQPASIDLDDRGNLFVADTVNSRVVVFDALGKVVRIFGKSGSGAGELRAPMALGVDDRRDRVYVADSSNYRLQVFKTDGQFLFTVDLNSSLEESEKKVRPLGVDVNKAGQIYVTDADNNLVRVYAPDGKFLFKFGGFGSEDGKFCIPVGVAVDSKDKIYVVDMNNSRVQIFDNKGNFLSKIGSAGDAKGNFGKPKDVEIDAKGRIFISDGQTLVVQVFDQEGNALDVIGASQDVESQFAAPFGLAVKENRLFVTDRWRNSIRVFEIGVNSRFFK